MIPQNDTCYYCGCGVVRDAHYCGACGHPLDVPRCGACSRLVSPGSRFCGTCAAPLSHGSTFTLATRPEEQLRQVTVVFALLSGLPILVEQYDPEELKDLIDACFKTLTARIRAREGTIDKYMVDSLLALFGVPVAHEDDPPRAVSAALGMLDAMEDFNRRLFETKGFQLGLKIGINTGKVLVGYVSQSTRDVTVLGDVVNTASRLEQEAPIGGILIGEATRRHLGDQFNLKAQPPLVVKGKQEPLTAFRVLREESSELEAGLDVSHLPFIGRETEFEQLVSSWRRMVRPEKGHMEALCPIGVWMTLWGDVGLGKERLLQEFIRYVALDPCRPQVYVTQGVSLMAGFEVLRRLIRALAGVLPQDGTETEVARIYSLAEKIAGIDPETDEQIRADVVARSWLRLVGMPAQNLSPRELTVRDPVRIRKQGIAHLRLLCTKLAEERPVLIVAYNLQWAEDAALEFFESLGNSPPGQLMLLTSARPTMLARRPDWGKNTSCYKAITLTPLSLSDSQLLARTMAGNKVWLSKELVDDLYHFSGGNPFYLTETLRNFLETRSASPAGATDLAVPDSIEGVIQSRLDRLSFDEGLTLRAAAVVGPTFWRGTITAVLGMERQDALLHLRERGFIQPCDSSLPGEEEYTFDHLLIAKVASGNLLESVRKRYHLATAEWFIGKHSEAHPLDLEIAFHLESADALPRATPYYARVGDRALAAYHCKEALEFFDKALKGIEQDDSGLERTLEAHLLGQRGDARRMLAEFESALADLNKAARIWQETGDQVAAATTWYRAGLANLALGQLEAATEAARRGDLLLAGQAAPTIQALGLHLRGELLIADGKSLDAKPPLEQAITLRRRLGEKWELAHSLHTMGLLQLNLSDYPLARRTFHEVVTLRDTLGDFQGLADTLHLLGIVAERQGQFPEALGHFHRSLRLHHRLNNQKEIPSSLIYQGAGFIRCGYFGRARDTLVESLERFRALDDSSGVRDSLQLLGTLWRKLGQYDRASSHLVRAIEHAEGQDSAWADIAYAKIELGRCCLLAGRIDEAERLGNEALLMCQDRRRADLEAALLHLLSATALARGQYMDAWTYLEELEWNEVAQVAAEVRMAVALLGGRIRMLEARPASALTRFQEAERVAREHDLIPGLWEARAHLWEVAKLMGAVGAGAAEAAARQAFQELLARVEDPELVLMLRQDASTNGPHSIVTPG